MIKPQDIQSLISQNLLKEAINVLNASANSYPHLKNEICLLSGRYISFESKCAIGELSSKEKLNEEACIRNAILSVSDRIFPTVEILKEIPRDKKERIVLFAIQIWKLKIDFTIDSLLFLLFAVSVLLAIDTPCKLNNDRFFITPITEIENNEIDTKKSTYIEHNNNNSNSKNNSNKKTEYDTKKFKEVVSKNFKEQTLVRLYSRHSDSLTNKNNLPVYNLSVFNDINEIEKNNLNLCFPDITKNEISIDLSSIKEDSISSIIIYNYFGVSLLSLGDKVIKKEPIFSLPIDDKFSNGCYLIHIKTNNNYFIKKFTVSR